MKYNFQEKAKMAGMTSLEIGVVGGSMLLSQKFLDFNVIFKNQIAKDPEYTKKWFMKHQGGVKFAVGVLAAIHISNPWLRLLAFAVAANGLIQEVRVLATKDGAPMFDKIGTSDFDKRLVQAAQSARTGAVGDQYQTMVAGAVGIEYPTQVARPVDLMNNNYTSVGNSVMERGMGVAMMR